MILIVMDILFSTFLIACIIFVILGAVWFTLKILYVIKRLLRDFDV